MLKMVDQGQYDIYVAFTVSLYALKLQQNLLTLSSDIVLVSNQRQRLNDAMDLY